ncbi:unnamed protein product [Adineta steineri]|uniref:Poly [ADP-ribose] polymerase n=1 Tax=Adineta steineri TaxID=433720 RepID=A0A814AQR2_9BILA|nr:unnamed protein product [Adineta steineri]CAF0981100.1 unnamed protein product [Adineta steineri]
MTDDSIWDADLIRHADIRLCCLCIWHNYDGFGCQLKAAPDPPHFIYLVESNSPATAGGLKMHDVILAINDQDMTTADLHEVEAAIETSTKTKSSVDLLVVQSDVYKILKERNIPIDSISATVIYTPVKMPTEFSNFPRYTPRLCKMRFRTDDTSLGFDIVNGENDIGAYIQVVLPNSLASDVGLRSSDRIIEINGDNVNEKSSEDIRNILDTATKNDIIENDDSLCRTLPQIECPNSTTMKSINNYNSMTLPKKLDSSSKQLDDIEIELDNENFVSNENNTGGYVKSDHTNTFSTRFDINESVDETKYKNFKNDYVRPKTSSTRTVVNIYNGSIQVLRGDLTRQMVDAIVVPSTSACLTAYVLREAGEYVQTAYEIEMQNNSMQSISVDCGGVLLCEKIYFIPCPDLLYNPDKWTFRNFISEAITMATNEKSGTIRSIAFPAIGCGKYNCNSDFVAKTLIMAAAYELERQPSEKLDVYFVIQQHQYDVFHAFENVLKFLDINGLSNMNDQFRTIETYLPSKSTTRHNNKNGFIIEKRLLDYSSNEYAMVVQSFCTTMTEGLCKEILRIELVWNNRWYKQYEIHRDEFNQRLKINTEQYLFHGCSQFAANNIIKECFNRSYAGQHGTKYGHGVYFSSQASYSHSYTEPNTRGERCMFLARVLVGNTIIGTKHTKICPRGFDTTTDGTHIYVIYHDAQAFGQYLITYK